MHYISKIVCCQDPLRGLTQNFPNSTRQYVVALDWKKDNFYPPIFPLTILFDSSIYIIYRVLVHPNLVDTEERVVSCPEEDLKLLFCDH